MIGIVLVLSWLVLAYGLVCLIVAIKRDAAKGIKVFCGQTENPDVMMERLEHMRTVLVLKIAAWTASISFGHGNHDQM